MNDFYIDNFFRLYDRLDILTDYYLLNDPQDETNINLAYKTIKHIYELEYITTFYDLA